MTDHDLKITFDSEFGPDCEILCIGHAKENCSVGNAFDWHGASAGYKGEPMTVFTALVEITDIDDEGIFWQIAATEDGDQAVSKASLDADDASNDGGEAWRLAAGLIVRQAREQALAEVWERGVRHAVSFGVMTHSVDAYIADANPYRKDKS